ncbi:mevalonate kinase family protein [Polaribacter sp.]|uniref:mevalonate kinase family protein n=1 Tax=Polaribacter sp. TaxID=1920175 RepID=UPI0040478641
MDKILSIAPGRTCLFGDHQDYLGLPIIACTINRHITLMAVKNNEDYFFLDKPDIKIKRKIYFKKDIILPEKADFFLSTLQVLKRYGCIPNCGYDIKITGTIPINAGTSSSSAIVVAWVQFLVKAFGPQELLTPENIAQIAFEAEVLEYNFPGGKMDQFSISLGNIIYLETGKDFLVDVINLPLEGLIIAESGVKKDTIGLLKTLKENSWKAIKEVEKQIPDFSIKDAKIEDLNVYLDCLSDDLKPYFEAALGNYDVTKKALHEFKKETLNLEKIGSLMNLHHHYLKNLLKITVPKIDDMIDAALKAGALGAKIVGSGGGGSIVVLSKKETEQQILDAILATGAKDAYAVSVDKGANVHFVNHF